jgi:hypothetical protein
MWRVTWLLLATVIMVPTAETPTATLPTTTNQDSKSLDPELLRKAEAAADAYEKNAAIRPNPEAELALADIEVLVLEGRANLDANLPLKAGEKYLEAVAKRKTIPDDQRSVLGQRLVKADRQMLQLSRELLGEAAFDLGDPSGAPPSKDAAATSPNAQPDPQPASK